MPFHVCSVPRGGRRSAAAAATAVLLLAGCGDAPASPPSTSSDQLIVGSFEEAALVALGELFRIYGADAGPAPLEVSGEIDTHAGQEVWRLDGTYEVTVDNQRRQHQWTI